MNNMLDARNVNKIRYESGSIAGMSDRQADFFPCCNQAVKLKSWRTTLLWKASLVLCSLSDKFAAAVVRRFTWLKNKRLRKSFHCDLQNNFFPSILLYRHVYLVFFCNMCWLEQVMIAWLHVCPRDARIRVRNHSVPKPLPYFCPYCLQ